VADKSSYNEIDLENIANFNELIGTNHSFKDGDVSVYFRGLKDRLISEINNSEMVLGAVAWLTDYDLLEAMSKKPCQIVLQKEDFLRPDMEVILSRSSKLKLREAYNNLSFEYTSVSFSNKIFELSYDEIFDIEPVRCFGLLTEKMKHCSPKMHNKFLIFCEFDTNTNKIKPKKVWSGSANLTEMSMYSLENAILIDNETIALQYLKEYEYIYYLSESLNWDSTWVSPFNNK
jgi:hypothetical protein|tara:strand:- start:2791 stop:3486 length:696 start_codon:yes stop_codon:yes gene_type:complete